MLAEEELDYGVAHWPAENYWDDGYGYEERDEAYELFDEEDDYWYGHGDDEDAYYEDEEVPRELEDAADNADLPHWWRRATRCRAIKRRSNHGRNHQDRKSECG